ncbi:hypothetical protein [Variovorax sp. LT1R16]|uniref:hypothetical protein n=1 Tax=Variovorax sp. LT1R16 TaxID=3443728 RepID=UPI003F485110
MIELERPDLVRGLNPVAHRGVKAAIRQLFGAAQENPAFVPELVHRVEGVAYYVRGCH